MPGKQELPSQACILSAPVMAEAVAEARALAQAALCTGAGPVPCGQCRACRKVLADIHPDLITLRRQTDDKGRQKREITVDQIRWLSADAVVRPNEAERKVYIIEDADKMNPQAQNAALKLLEEPPAGALFLLCACNPSLLLPTVRSRCTERRAGTAEQPPEEEAAKMAAGYWKALCSGDRGVLLRWCAANENCDTRQALAFAEAAQAEAVRQLSGGSAGLSRAQLIDLCRLLERCGAWLKVNTGVKHIFGLLAVDSPVSGGNRGNSID